jgi:exosortase
MCVYAQNMSEIVAPPSTTPSAALRQRLALGVATLGLLVLFVFWPYQHWDFMQRSSIVGGILRKAQQDAEWWFCLFTPFIVGWLVWRMRKQLRQIPVAGSWWGLPFLLLAMVFYWFGYKADTAYPGYVSAQFLTLGLILTLGGTAWLQQLLFPWMFLVFTWPMIPLESLLALPLRMLTAQAAGLVLNIIGVDVIREGTGLLSAADEARELAQGQLFQLDVEEPCSGIRSLFSLLMISALYGWLSLKTWPPRGLLFASAIPLAMLGNLVRMVLLALGSIWFGTEFAVGRNIDGQQEMSFFHSLAGFAVFGVALGGMFAVCTLLEKRLDRRPKMLHGSFRELQVAGSPLLFWAQLGSVITILGGALGICAMTDASYQVAPANISPDMPAQVLNFVSTDQPMTSREQSILAEDVRIGRRLYTTTDRAILATAVLSGAEKRSLHSPDDCLPAQGWMVSSESIITMDVGDGKEVSATLMSMFRDVVDKGGQRVRIRGINIFWYVGSDGTTCAGYQEHVIKTYTDAFFKNINHRWTLLTFFVPLKVSVAGFEDPFAELAAVEETKVFIRELLPKIKVP